MNVGSSPIKKIALILLMSLMTLSMSSCAMLMGLASLSGSTSYEEIATDSDTAAPAPETENSSEPQEPPQNVDQTVIQNQIVINGTGGNDVSLAAASGLRSAVSIFASFSSGSVWGGSSASAGSGVIYKLDEKTGSAFVITNYHVIYHSSYGVSKDISLYLYGMEYTEYKIPATFVGGSANYDLAVLYVKNSQVLKDAMATGSVAAVTVADSDLIVAGQTAIAIGNPEASGISVTTGIVSVDSEYIEMTASNNSGTVSLRVIRIDTAVNSGNSGGGLFNGKGELIGIVNAKISSSDVENIGYAIPTGVVRGIADNIIDYCHEKDCITVMRGLLGITVTCNSYSTVYDTETGLMKRVEEIMVYEVNTGGLASKILQKGDIISSITLGERTVSVTRQHHLIDAMLDVRVGDTVTIAIKRTVDGTLTDMTVSTTITEDCLTAY